jgi:hypothetical protein
MNMRIKNKQFFNLLVIIVVSVLLNGSSPAMQKTNPHSGFEQEVILDIRDYCAGTCDRPRRLVYFRLYENGQAEFEASSDIDILGGLHCCGISRYKVQLDAEASVQINKLINQRDFMNARSEYKRPSNAPGIVVVRSIQFMPRNKIKRRILMENYSNRMTHTNDSYPASITLLMNKIKQIRERLDRADIRKTSH